MKYVKVRWVHGHSGQPVMLYSELDDDMWEIRKVEVYANGHADFADNEVQSGTTMLGVVPIPPLDQIAADPEFEPMAISAAEFEILWERAKSSAERA